MMIIQTGLAGGDWEMMYSIRTIKPWTHFFFSALADSHQRKARLTTICIINVNMSSHYCPVKVDK